MIDQQAIAAAIESLKMMRELMLFDPSTGEDIRVESLNKDNKDLYDAAHTALACMRECAERREGCEYCLQGEDLAYGHDSMQRTGRIYIDGNLLTADLYSESMAVAVCCCPMCGRNLERSDT